MRHLPFNFCESVLSSYQAYQFPLNQHTWAHMRDILISNLLAIGLRDLVSVAAVLVGGYLTYRLSDLSRIAKLRLMFSANKDLIAENQTADGTVYYYLRGLVRNESKWIALGCRVYLTEIQFRPNKLTKWQRFVSTDYILIRWSNRRWDQEDPAGVDKRFDPVDLPKHVPHAIDVLRVNSNDEKFNIQWHNEPTRFQSLVENMGTIGSR